MEPLDHDLTLLADALRRYLEEVNGWRLACVRHEEDARVREGEVPAVCHWFTKSPRMLDTLDCQLERLRPVKGHPRQSGGRSHAGSVLFRPSVDWEGQPLSIVVRESPRGVLVVEVELLPFHADLPMPPVRRVAGALACHEFLVPASVAVPLPFVPPFGGELTTLGRYMVRNGHLNPPSVQRFFVARAGHCANPGRSGPIPVPPSAEHAAP